MKWVCLLMFMLGFSACGSTPEEPTIASEEDSEHKTTVDLPKTDAEKTAEAGKEQKEGVEKIEPVSEEERASQKFNGFSAVDYRGHEWSAFLSFSGPNWAGVRGIGPIETPLQSTSQSSGCDLSLTTRGYGPETPIPDTHWPLGSVENELRLDLKTNDKDNYTEKRCTYVLVIPFGPSSFVDSYPDQYTFEMRLKVIDFLGGDESSSQDKINIVIQFEHGDQWHQTLLTLERDGMSRMNGEQASYPLNLSEFFTHRIVVDQIEKKTWKFINQRQISSELELFTSINPLSLRIVVDLYGEYAARIVFHEIKLSPEIRMPGDG